MHAVKRNEINKCVGIVEEIKTSLREKEIERERD